MRISDGQLKAFYLAGVGLNAIGLAVSIDSGEYLFAGAFGFIILYLMVRYRMVTNQ